MVSVGRYTVWSSVSRHIHRAACVQTRQGVWLATAAVSRPDELVPRDGERARLAHVAAVARLRPVRLVGGPRSICNPLVLGLGLVRDRAIERWPDVYLFMYGQRWCVYPYTCRQCRLTQQLPLMRVPMCPSRTIQTTRTSHCALAHIVRHIIRPR